MSLSSPVSAGNVKALLESGIIADMLYPVGSIYLSASDANPATLFGGTWQRIEGRFLYASDDAHEAGTTGGSNDAVVVSHTHSGTAASNGAHTHSATADSAGSHNHSISGGSHSHTASTNSTGSHSHSYGESLLAEGEQPGDVNATTKYQPHWYVHLETSTASAGSHSHSVTVANSSSHSHTVGSGGSHSHDVTVGNGGSHSHTVTVSAAGESATDKNMPAYLSVYAWRRTA